MDLVKLKELINKSVALVGGMPSQQVARHFEEFVNLYAEKDNHQGDPVFTKKLSTAFHQFYISFHALAKQYGFTPATLKAHFENPANFTPAQWNHIQSIKEQVGVKDAPVQTQPPKRRAKNLKNKEMRI